jgi:hypothetical protein
VRIASRRRRNTLGYCAGSSVAVGHAGADGVQDGEDGVGGGGRVRAGGWSPGGLDPGVGVHGDIRAGAAGAGVGGEQGGDTAVRGQPGLDAVGGERVGDGGEIPPGVAEVLAEAGLFLMSGGHMSCLSGEDERPDVPFKSALANCRAAIL